MPNSANNDSLNITDEVIKKSATIKAYTEWKKNTSYSEDIKNKVEIRTNSGSYDLMGKQKEEFPATPKIEEKNKISISGSIFRNAIIFPFL